jgi:hypothetical protein
MPEYNFIIHGDATPEEKEDHEEWAQGWLKESMRPIEGELEKTPQELKLLNLINDDVESNFATLGLENPPAILPEQIHFLNDKGFTAVLGQRGEHDNPGEPPAFQKRGAVYVNRERYESKVQLVDDVAHECFHLASVHKFIANGKKLAEYRLGYNLISSRAKSFEPFRGLNEAVTEQSVMEFMHKYKSSLVQEFGIDAADLSAYRGYAYKVSRAILTRLISGIAAYRGEEPFAVWHRIERGMYSGDMMHLRDIAKAFDARTFQLVSMAGNRLGQLSFKDVNEKVAEFLYSTDPKIKDQIYAELEAARESGEPEVGVQTNQPA